MSEILCPCGSGKDYEECCKPYIDGVSKAPSPEALMRSRFTAFSKGILTYIEKTSTGPAKESFNLEAARGLAKEAHWEKLQVLASRENGDEGTVEYRATFTLKGKSNVMYEISTFKKIGGVWFYYSGDVQFNR